MISAWTDWLHHWVFEISELFMVVFELMGALVLVYGAVSVLVRFIHQSRTDTVGTGIRVRFARTISMALELYLAAEILKTVTVQSDRELATVGVIVVLRTMMAVLIHWEMGHEVETLPTPAKAQAHVGGESDTRAQ